MKKTKKILAIAIILMLILGSLTFVKAVTNDITISEGKRVGDTAIFYITVPEGMRSKR